MTLGQKLSTGCWLPMFAGVGVSLLNLALEYLLAPTLLAISLRAHGGVASAYVCIALAVALVLAACALLAELLRFVPWFGAAARTALLLGIAAAVPLALLGGTLTEGAWAEQQAWAHALPALLATVGGVGVAVVARIAMTTKWWPALTVLFSIATIATVVADVVMLPGLYDEVHLALKVVAVTGALVVVTRVAWLGVMPRLNNIAAALRYLAMRGLVVSVIAPLAWWGGTVRTRTELVLRGGAATNLIQMLHSAPSVTYLSHELQRLEGQHTPLPPLRERVIAEEPPVKNALLLFVDTLRADALPPARGDTNDYATDRDTPFLNEFLKGCFTFERAYAQSSATHRSMPATFRSLATWEPASRSGQALGNVFASHGLHTTAVVNNYFFEPRYRDASDLVDGFNEVKVFDSHRQSGAKSMVDRTLASIGDERFFMWTHFFAVHNPGYDGKLLSTKIPHKERYRRSLKWLDATLKYVVERLRHHGHADDTVIILASDHGEGLGANNQNAHGPTVFEEEIRVPLAFCLPKSEAFAEPRVISETVSNIDIVPTLHELLGLPPSAAHRGSSHAPAFRDGAPVVQRPVYFENANRRRIGVADGVDKLIYHPNDELFFRFDIADDPTEEENLFALDDAKDAALRRQLFLANPDLLKAEVKANRALIESRLAKVNPTDPGLEAEFLLALAAHADDRDIEAEAARIFRGSDDPRVKFWVLRYFRERPLAGSLIRETVPTLGAAEEAAFVALAADAGVEPGKGHEAWVRKQMLQLPPDGARWDAWLKLVARWPRKSADWAPVFARVLTQVAQQPDAFAAGTLFYALDNVATVRWSRPDAALIAQVRAHLDDERQLVRRAAITALGTLKDEASYDAIRELAQSAAQGRRIHQVALHALAKIDPARAPEVVVEVASKDVHLVHDALKVLEPLGDVDGIRALGEKHRRHRGLTKRAVDRIEKKAKN